MLSHMCPVIKGYNCKGAVSETKTKLIERGQSVLVRARIRSLARALVLELGEQSTATRGNGDAHNGQSGRCRAALH